jgi:hypothetical protein
MIEQERTDRTGQDRTGNSTAYKGRIKIMRSRKNDCISQWQGIWYL